MFDRAAPDRRIQLRWDLAGVLSATAVLVAAETAFIVFMLGLRLVAQFMAWTHVGVPLSWLYWSTGLYVLPFSGLETVRQMQPVPTIEFSTMVALETYMVGGLVLVLLFGGLSLLARRRPARSWAWTMDAGPAFDTWDNLEPSLAAVAEDADYRGRSGWRALRARLAGIESRRPLS